MKQTNFPNSQKYDPKNYPDPGQAYKNTDEVGHVEIIVANHRGKILTVELDVFDIIERQIIEERETRRPVPETPPQGQIVTLPEEGRVSEEFMLKTLSVVINQEKYKDL